MYSYFPTYNMCCIFSKNLCMIIQKMVMNFSQADLNNILQKAHS